MADEKEFFNNGTVGVKNMARILTFFLIAIIGITISSNAFAKDDKITHKKPAAPVIIDIKEDPYNPAAIFITASGATSKMDRYTVYFAEYDGDENKKSWKWLKENGTSYPNNYPYPLTTSPKYLTTEIAIAPKGNQQLIFTVTIVDIISGKESDPAPIQIH